VLRLREVYSNVAQDKEKLVEENKQLKSMLTSNGGMPADDIMSNPSVAGYTSSSLSGSYAAGSNSAQTPPVSHSTATSVGGSSNMAGIQHHGLGNQNYQQLQQHQQKQQSTQEQPTQNRVDYEQAGIDFVLTYDNPDDPSKAYMSPPR
jgi:hypothetical protein